MKCLHLPLNLSEPISKPAQFLRKATGGSLAALAIAVLFCLPGQAQVEWPQFGQNNSNTSGNHQETTITASTVSQLEPKWKFTTKGDVSARPAVVNGVVYFPDWGGYLWAVNASTGKAIWGNKLSSYVTNPATGKPYTTSVWARATPAVRNGMLYIGLHGANGYFLGINASNGKLVWKTRLDTVDPYAGITSSASVNGTTVYVGVTSDQEGQEGGGAKTARGSVVALNGSNGKIIWKTYMVPSGYTGAAVWGSSPVVDSSRGLVYVATGNNYTTPTASAYVSCIKSGKTAENCQSSANYADAIVALKISSGAVKWAKRLEDWPQDNGQSGSDYSNASCSKGEPGCPTPDGPDFDFASAPNEITSSAGTFIGAGQKSGIYYALNPTTGAIVWQTQVGPGSHGGGIMWGSATDGERIYVAIADKTGIAYSAGNAGSWAALNPANGAIEWQVPDPFGAFGVGPVAVANGVVYVSSTAEGVTDKNMIALNASNGATLWGFAPGVSTIGGATIVNGAVYWGTGYSRSYTGGENALYAFTLGGK